MALSNWDTVVFDSDGNQGKGEIESFTGAICEVYKDWLYVKDTKAWYPSQGFSSNVIAKISEGDIRISGFEIQATRGPQNSVIAYVCSTNYKTSETRRMFAVSGNGFEDDEELRIIKRANQLGFSITTKLPVCIGLTSGWGQKESGEQYFYIEAFGENEENVEIEIPFDESLQSKWVGIQPETMEFAFKWLYETLGGDHHIGDGERKDWYDKIRKVQAVRYNQGDVFFTSVKESQTPIGEANKTIFEKML